MGDMLNDPRHVRADLKLLERAARWGGLTPDRKDRVAREMLRIVKTRDATIVDNDGDEHEITNARNQVAAARVLVAMEAQNQSDDQLGRKESLKESLEDKKKPQGITINVNVLNIEDQDDQPQFVAHQSNAAALESPTPTVDPTENIAPQNGNGKH